MRRLAVPLGFLAAGCGAPPVEPPEIDLAMPPVFLEAPAPADAAMIADWTRSFHDPRLWEIVSEALANNPDLAVAAARLDAAAAEARIAGADVFPQLNVGGTATRRQQVLVGIFPGDPVTTRATTYGVSLDASWELDLWGRVRNTRSAGLADREAVAADLEGAKLSLAAQTIKAWFAIVEAERQAELAEQTARSYDQTVKSVRARFEEGVRPAIDLRLTLVEQARANAQLARRRSALAAARRQMEILLGRVPAGAFEAPADLSDPPPAVPAGLPADLLLRRPDLVAAERRLAAAGRRVAASKRALLPRISLTASGGATSDHLEDVLKGDFSVWSLVGNLTQPLFQGGRLLAAVDRAQAGQEQAVAVWVGSVLRALAEVETALELEGSLVEQETALAESSKQATAAHALARSRYEAGLADVLTLLSAQRSAADAESAMLSIRRARLDNRIDLHLALGGGFRLEEGSS